MYANRFLTPGPGSYEPLKPFGHRGYTMSIKGRVSRHKHMDEVNIRTMNAWSPGPASYLPNYKRSSEKTHGVSCIIAGDVKNHFNFQKGGESPGPAAYSPSLPRSIGSTPNTKFGKEARVTGVTMKEARPNEPGPGAYEAFVYAPIGVMGIQGFMAGKPLKNGRPVASHSAKDVPGPGTYTPNNNFNDTLSIKGGMNNFGTGERFLPDATPVLID
jgi:hypothetical protein